MRRSISQNKLEEIWKSVPPDYYQKGIKKNLFQRLWHAGKLKAVLSQIESEPKTILDVGCASGWFLSQLQQVFPQTKCIGVDVYSEAVKYGQKIYHRLTLKTADIHKLPFTHHAFDLTICTEVLEHVVNPSQVLREIKRVTKPNGEIIIEMDSGNWLFRLIWSFWTELKGKVWTSAHIQTFDAKKLKRTIEKAGLKIEHEKFFNFGMAVVYKCRP